MDLRIKKELVEDTFKLLGKTVKMKKKLERLKKKLVHDRNVMGKKTSLNKGTFKERCLLEKDSHMLENCDNFERIFPLQDYHHDELDENYDLFAKKATFITGHIIRD